MTYRIVGERPGLTAIRVTERLGILPTRDHELGQLINPRRSTRTFRHSYWGLSSGDLEDGVELSEQLNKLLIVLEPVTDELWKLVEEGYWANWFCWVASNAYEHASELDRPLLQRLLALPGDLWIHADGDDEDDDEEDDGEDSDLSPGGR